MDTSNATTIAIIVVIATLLLFGALVYKALWFIRKVQDAPDTAATGTDISSMKKSGLVAPEGIVEKLSGEGSEEDKAEAAPKAPELQQSRDRQ